MEACSHPLCGITRVQHLKFLSASLPLLAKQPMEQSDAGKVVFMNSFIANQKNSKLSEFRGTVVWWWQQCSSHSKRSQKTFSCLCCSPCVQWVSWKLFALHGPDRGVSKQFSPKNLVVWVHCRHELSLLKGLSCDLQREVKSQQISRFHCSPPVFTSQNEQESQKFQLFSSTNWVQVWKGILSKNQCKEVMFAFALCVHSLRWVLQGVSAWELKFFKNLKGRSEWQGKWRTINELRASNKTFSSWLSLLQLSFSAQIINFINVYSKLKKTPLTCGFSCCSFDFSPNPTVASFLFRMRFFQTHIVPFVLPSMSKFFQQQSLITFLLQSRRMMWPKVPHHWVEDENSTSNKNSKKLKKDRLVQKHLVTMTHVIWNMLLGGIENFLVWMQRERTVKQGPGIFGGCFEPNWNHVFCFH